jgi:hypothetical protein
MMIYVQRFIGFVLALALAALAIVFASVVFAFAAAFALIIGGWLWWRTRGLRREIRRAAERGQGTVIEGEYRIERDTRRVDRR